MNLRVNHVTRGDLRSRLASPKVLWVLRLYVAALGVLAVFSLPPQGGRSPALAEGDLAQLFFVFQVAWVVYLTSALAVGEIGVEGEKGILDLSVTSFPSRMIASGKLWTALLSASALVVLSLPLVILITPDRAAAPGALRALAAMVPLAAPLALMGAWLPAAIPSDVLRTVLHWSVFLLIFAATRWLPDPLMLLNPMRMVGAAYLGEPALWPLALAPYLLAGALGWYLIHRTVQVRRREMRP
ncbi:MAG TPA: hypothetical protein VGR25_00620 [bacterium]|jgi:hypothetical protein|nr:hypothetical protein [bacterium]